MTRVILLVGVSVIVSFTLYDAYSEFRATQSLYRAQDLAPLGRYDEALMWLDHASTHAARSAHIYLEQGRVYERLYVFRRQQRHLDAALNSYYQAIALNPLDAEAFAELGQVYLRADRLVAAEAAISKARLRDPYHTRYIYLLGRIREAEGRIDEAIAHYRQALAIHFPQVYISNRIKRLQGLR